MDDKINQWIDATEKNLRKADYKINALTYLILGASLSVISFFIGIYLFKNFTASILLAVSFFILPEHWLNIKNKRKEEKIKEQMLVAIRIFSAEFLQTPQIEKGIEAVGKRVGDPVGKFFRQAHKELIIKDTDIALANLANNLSNEYGKLFVQLLEMAKKDSTVSFMFPELLNKIERNIEATRKNKSDLSGEKVLSLIMALIPIPVYLIMSYLVPETSYFLAETSIGRLIIIVAFGSILLWAVLDSIISRVEV